EASVIPLLAALSFMGRIFLILSWFAIATLVAGIGVWLMLFDRDSIAAAVIAGVLLLAPGIWLLHLQWALRFALRRVLDAGLTSMSLYRSGHLGVLLLPWYWAGVVVAAIAGVVLIPVAIILALLRL